MGCRINVLHSQTTLENDERYVLAGMSLYTGCPIYRSARRTRVNRGRERVGERGKGESRKMWRRDRDVGNNESKSKRLEQTVCVVKC